MAWCLTRDQETRFRNALVSKKIDPFKLAEMASEQRLALFEQYVDSENAININSLFESKLLLKNQVTGFKNWAKRAVGMKPEVKRDLLSKIERLDDLGVLTPEKMNGFMADLAKTRLGFGITFEEAKTINQLSEDRVESKEKWETKIKENPEWENDPQKTRKQWIKDPVRFQYGLKQVVLENYVNDLKLEAKNKRVSFKEDPINAVLNPIKEAPGFFNDLFKSLMASIDDSFFGRQGIKNLFGSPSQKRIWTRNFVKSFSDMAAELRRGKKTEGFGPMDFIKADIYSRPNALNGKYKAGNYQLEVLNEEVFPIPLPETIPGLGRLFRASETAFNGGALTMRADLADLFISKMDAQGLNTKNPDVARGAGHLVGSLTGRGSLGKLTTINKELNFVLWSARFFKANIDTLTAHQFDPQATKFTKTEARKNLVSIVGHVAGIMMLAKFLDPESVDEDPTSTNFGKIKIFGHWTDITGGMRTIVIMAARLVPHKRNGEWGVWKKSSTGRVTNMVSGEFGVQDAVDVFMESFFLNRLAPVASVIRDFYRGEMFGGDPFDIKKSIVNSALPLSIQNVNEVKDEKFEVILGVAISEFFGLGVSTYKYEDNWEIKTSKEMKQFKEQVGIDKFKEANQSYNRAYNAWAEEIEQNPQYKSLSKEGKESLQSSAKAAIKKKIFDEYGYDNTQKPETMEELREKEKIKLLKPVSNLIKGVGDVLSNINLMPKVYAFEEDNPITNIEINGDDVLTTWKNGKTRSSNLYFDDNFIQDIGRLFHDVGTKIGAKEFGLSEFLGFETREEKIAELMKYKEKVLDKSDVFMANPDKKEEKKDDFSKVVNTDFGRNPVFEKIKPPKSVDSAIRKASSEFNVPAGLLFDIAQQESSLNPKIVNTTSVGKDAGNPTGLFQFTDSTWENVIKFNDRKGSVLYRKLKNTDRTDPETNAMAAAFLIHVGQLGKWDASEDVWGEFWTLEELEEMGFYKQTIHHKKGTRASIRLAQK